MAELAEKIYADALFSSAVEENCLEEVKADLEGLYEAFKGNTEFFGMMDAPTFEKEEKTKILKETFEGKTEKLLYNFICLLCDKKRTSLFLKISESFFESYRDYHGFLEVNAVSAVALSEEQKEKLREKLSALTGKKILLKTQVEPSVIGGIILRYDNKEIDGSVQKKLDSLRNTIRGVIA